jgi:hypothetical protein
VLEVKNVVNLGLSLKNRVAGDGRQKKR